MKWVFVTPGEIWALLRQTQAFLTDRLDDPDAPRTLIVTFVAPLAAINCIAVFVRSLIVESLLAGFILGIGTFALQLGVWLSLAIILPAIARQFHTTIEDDHSFALATYASVPMWLATILFVIPDDYWLVSLWARLAIFGVSTFGLFILQRGFVVLDVRPDVRTPLLVSIAVAYAAGYALLSMLVGLTAHILLYILT